MRGCRPTGVHDDPNRRSQYTDQSQRLAAIHDRHFEVEDENVDAAGLRDAHRGPTIAHRSDHVDVRSRTKKTSEGKTDGFVIVSDPDSQFLSHTAL